MFSFSVCLFIRKHQGLQFCKNVCKLENIGTCEFDFRTIFGFGMMKSVYLCIAQLKIVIFSNFFHSRSHPNAYTSNGIDLKYRKIFIDIVQFRPESAAK